ncbi:hypothetical protein NMG60_11016855 [Bertholletia excelsa]
MWWRWRWRWRRRWWDLWKKHRHAAMLQFCRYLKGPGRPPDQCLSSSLPA